MDKEYLRLVFAPFVRYRWPIYDHGFGHAKLSHQSHWHPWGEFLSRCLAPWWTIISQVRITTDLLLSSRRFWNFITWKKSITRWHDKIVCEISERFVVLSHQRCLRISKDGPWDTVYIRCSKKEQESYNNLRHTGERSFSKYRGNS